MQDDPSSFMVSPIWQEQKSTASSLGHGIREDGVRMECQNFNSISNIRYHLVLFRELQTENLGHLYDLQGSGQVVWFQKFGNSG